MDVFEINAGNFRETANAALLKQVIEIQKENFRDEESESKSFLLTVWSEEELMALASKGSSFFVCSDHGILVGYFAISSLTDFLKQLDESLKNNFDHSVLNNSKPWAYLYQICVRRGRQGAGISKLIAAEVVRRRPGTSFVSDYLISPWKNEGSEKMFLSFGFKKSGEMLLASYRGVESTLWQIVTSP